MNSSSSPSYPDLIPARNSGAFGPRLSAKPRILCVDDEPLILAGLDFQLRARCRVLSAVCGEKALHVIQTEPDITVVLSDLHMGTMDGISFLTRVREVAPRIMTILITGALDDASMTTTLRQPAVDRVLIKPCSTDELREAVRLSIEDYRSGCDD
jgi:CheY-like chemotaxis protein